MIIDDVKEKIIMALRKDVKKNSAVGTRMPPLLFFHSFSEPSSHIYKVSVLVGVVVFSCLRFVRYLKI